MASWRASQADRHPGWFQQALDPNPKPETALEELHNIGKAVGCGERPQDPWMSFDDDVERHASQAGHRKGLGFRAKLIRV